MTSPTSRRRLLWILAILALVGASLAAVAAFEPLLFRWNLAKLARWNDGRYWELRRRDEPPAEVLGLESWFLDRGEWAVTCLNEALRRPDLSTKLTALALLERLHEGEVVDWRTIAWHAFDDAGRIAAYLRAPRDVCILLDLGGVHTGAASSSVLLLEPTEGAVRLWNLRLERAGEDSVVIIRHGRAVGPRSGELLAQVARYLSLPEIQEKGEAAGRGPGLLRTRWYAREQASREGGAFVPGASTWLRGASWNDVLAEDAAAFGDQPTAAEEAPAEMGELLPALAKLLLHGPIEAAASAERACEGLRLGPGEEGLAAAARGELSSFPLVGPGERKDLVDRAVKALDAAGRK